MKPLHSFIKTIITILFFIFDSITLLISKIFSSKKSVNKILMVNLGALGDNLIFLNTLLEFNNQKELVIIVDKQSKIIFDNQNFQKIYYINRKKYIQNIFYRIKINMLFSNYRFSKILNVRGSRNVIYEDSLMRFIKGEKIALQSDYSSNSRLALNLIDAMVYNKIIKFQIDKYPHELQRMYILFNSVFNTNKKVNIINIDYCFEKKFKKRKIDKKYFVLNVGAGKKFRKWDIKNYILLGNKMEEKFNITPIYCGINEDFIALQNASIKPSKNSMNLCGETTLEDLINIIKFCEFSISNDSAAAHLSIFLHKKTICIKSKFDHNRFFPYPKKIISDRENVVSKKNIADISVDDVLEIIV
jgi:ADP-heptose:LPS heptosyltransferase